MAAPHPAGQADEAAAGTSGRAGGALQKIIAERRDRAETRLVTGDLHDRFEPGLGMGAWALLSIKPVG